MKTSDRKILYGLAAVVVLAGFWFLILSPKRGELGELDSKVAAAQAATTQNEQLAALAEQSKESYKADYQEMVVLGKAVPGDDDVSSLLEQVNGLAERSDVEFNSLVLAADGAADATAAAVTPPPVVTAPPTGDGSATPAATGVPATPTAVPATEAAAATLPLGAAVGSAGLPAMPYDLSFTGEFFDIADFMAGLDGFVRVEEKGGVGVDGRLLTVDGFSLAPDEGSGGFPHLQANLHVTSYISPPDQGLTGGATPTAPAAAVPASTTTAPPLATSQVPTP
jgi:Tfp pilus assembly protein PilO